jgi:hypothetical protein
VDLSEQEVGVCAIGSDRSLRCLEGRREHWEPDGVAQPKLWTLYLPEVKSRSRVEHRNGQPPCTPPPVPAAASNPACSEGRTRWPRRADNYQRPESRSSGLLALHSPSDRRVRECPQGLSGRLIDMARATSDLYFARWSRRPRTWLCHLLLEPMQQVWHLERKTHRRLSADR